MEVRIPARDTAYILAEAELSTAVVDAFETAHPEGPLLVLELEPETAADLLVGVLNASLRAGDQRDRQAAESIAERIQAQLERQGMEIAIERREIVTEDEEANETPREDFGGFTPREVDTLLRHDWDPQSPGVQIHAAGTEAELARSYTLASARVFLDLAASAGRKGVRATAAGNLNRAFVTELREATVWPERERWFLDLAPRTLNEEGAGVIHALRVLLELAELLERQGRHFVLTDRGAGLRDPDRAAELQAALVRTTFRTFNLAYRDRMVDLPDFQHTTGFAMAVLARSQGGWLDTATARRDLLLPAVAAQVPHDPLLDLTDLLVELRLLRYLEELGLVSCERQGTGPHGTERIHRFRTTDLFAATVRLDLDGPAPPRPAPPSAPELDLLGSLDDLDLDGPVH